MADEFRIDTTELDRFLRDLRKAGSGIPKAVLDAQRDVVKEVAEWGKDDLGQEPHPTQRHVSRLKAIRANVSTRRTAVRLDATARRNAMALGAVIGSKRFPQFPRYRDPGHGWPDRRSYPPFSTVAERGDEIVDMLLDAIEHGLELPFPDKTPTTT